MHGLSLFSSQIYIGYLCKSNLHRKSKLIDKIQLIVETFSYLIEKDMIMNLREEHQNWFPWYSLHYSKDSEKVIVPYLIIDAIEEVKQFLTPRLWN